MAFTELVDAGEPDVVDKPHDTTLNFSNPPAFFLNAALSKASAIGLRHVLPVQTIITVSRSVGMTYSKSIHEKVQPVITYQHRVLTADNRYLFDNAYLQTVWWV